MRAVWGRPGPEAEALIHSTVLERVRRLPSAAREMIPTSIVVDQFPLMALRLSHDAPAQHEEYDRTRAEAEFRIHIAPPVMVLGAVFAFRLPLWWGVLAVALATLLSSILMIQGLRERDRAEQLLATAMYFGYTSAPILDALAESAEERFKTEDDHDPDLQAIAWLCDFLFTRSRLSPYGSLVSKLRHPSRASITSQAARYMQPQTRFHLTSLGAIPETDPSAASRGEKSTLDGSEMHVAEET